jgi:midasin
MFSLTFRCLEFKEPVLLIGQTGCGKTTLAQLIAQLLNVPLYMVNCHQYTESSDFIGSIRPLRNRDKIVEELTETLTNFTAPVEVLTILQSWKNGGFAMKHETLVEKIESLAKTSEDLDLKTYIESDEGLKSVLESGLKMEQVFEWVDGPLVNCMKNGGVLLIDEISLAQDSVLERLNSVLEREKSLTLSEKGDGSVIELKAHEKCIIIATMNPSGDFGKRELTPALRNRFTEIWVEPITAPSYLNQNAEYLTSQEL